MTEKLMPQNVKLAVNVLLPLIEQGTLRTAKELAEAIYGENAQQQRVNRLCVWLVEQGLVWRHGAGTLNDQFRYEATP